MWLLIIAIVILVVSTNFAAYLAEAYTASIKFATFAKQVAMLLVIVGVVLLFIATDWKIGLAGIGGAWVSLTLFRVLWRGRLDTRP